MITNAMARSLRGMLIPPDQKFSATLTLLPSSGSPTVLSLEQCWWKPLDVTLSEYSGVMLEGKERLINIPAEQITAGLWIRELDQIEVAGVTFVVKTAGLRSVSSRWECLVREMPTT